jgi:hypothetical protein
VGVKPGFLSQVKNKIKVYITTHDTTITGLEDFTFVAVKITLFWNLTLCSVRRFGGRLFLKLQSEE